MRRGLFVRIAIVVVASWATWFLAGYRLGKNVADRYYRTTGTLTAVHVPFASGATTTNEFYVPCDSGGCQNSPVISATTLSASWCMDETHVWAARINPDKSIRCYIADRTTQPAQLSLQHMPWQYEKTTPVPAVKSHLTSTRPISNGEVSTTSYQSNIANLSVLNPSPISVAEFDLVLLNGQHERMKIFTAGGDGNSGEDMIRVENVSTGALRLEVRNDGTIIYGDGYTASDAATDFWKSMYTLYKPVCDGEKALNNIEIVTP